MKRYITLAAILVAITIPSISLAAPACTDPASSSLCNPFTTNPKFPKVDTFTEFTIFILGVFGGLAGIGSILYITFAGFRFLISQGNEERIEKAKNNVQWTLLGLALMIISFALVQALEQALKYQGVKNPNVPTNPIAITNFTRLYQALIEGFFGIMALVAILMIIISGYRYITAGGNEETTTQAKKTILYAILGMGISILGYVIVHSVGRFFGKV